MAKNEPTKPEEANATPATETPTDETKQPDQPLEAGGINTPPVMTAEEKATPTQEAGAALHDTGEGQTSPPNLLTFPLPMVMLLFLLIKSTRLYRRKKRR